ncbi:MAG: hypothetical protein ACK5G0_06995 [Bacteroidota bacterium]|jgi:hypothetical protein
MCNKRHINIFLLPLSTLLWLFSAAQETLPAFSLNKLNDDRVLIQWKNPDTSIRQLSIQQSADSLSGFRTILTMPDPTPEQNGTIISRPMAGKMFYRIYLLYPGGRYRFSFAKRPVPIPAAIPVSGSVGIPDRPVPQKTTLNPAESSQDPGQLLIPTPTPRTKKDTAVAIPPVSRIQPKIGNVPDLTPGQRIDIKKTDSIQIDLDKFTPSLWVYTHRDGYPLIQLPATWDLSQVRIRFFQENGQILFELKQPPLHHFRIDKSNFSRSGWYSFEIILKGKVIEKNRLYIPLEF